MTEQNVEVVRAIYESLTRGGEDLMELVGTQLVVDFSRRLVDPFVVTLDSETIDAYRDAYRSESLETWEKFPTWEPQELVDAGDKVFASIRTRARGKESGVEVDAYVTNVWRFEDGKAVELKYFGEDRAAALKDAGLSK